MSGGDAGLYYDGFELIEDQGQLRGTFSTQPEVRNTARGIGYSHLLR